MSRTIEDILKLFPDTTAPDWTQHTNGGGWVQSTAHAEESTVIEGMVFGNAQVSGNAWETSPLYIQGSAHCATNVKHGYIAIGCEVHTYAEWLKNYKAIGAKAGYSEEQIKEYKAIIDLFVKVGR